MTEAGEPAIRIRIMRMPGASDLPLPRPATEHSAGFDLRAAVDGSTRLEPGARALLPTGIAIALPEGWEAQVRPRSGLAWKHGLTLLNGPGTVDADYRGEIKVILANLGEKAVTIERGDRIAQLVIQRLPRIRLDEVEQLPSSERGAGGFGHTGAS